MFAISRLPTSERMSRDAARTGESPSAGGMETQSSPTKGGRRPPHWVYEGLLIVVSAVLGYGAAQLGEHRANRELADRVLAGVRAELEHNRALLAPIVPLHGVWVEALANVDPDTTGDARSALDLYFATRPALPDGLHSAFPFLRRSAWDAALSGGTLRFIDYDLAAALSELYRVQETATDNVNLLAHGALSQTAIYDPASRAPAVRLLWLTLADIQSAEAVLLDLYEKHLPALQHAARPSP